MACDFKRRTEVDPSGGERSDGGVNQGRASARSTSGNSAVHAETDPALDERIQNHLGRKLKEAYADLVRQPVPDKFSKLLAELERQEKK